MALGHLRACRFIAAPLAIILLATCGEEAKVKAGFHEHGNLTISMLRVSMRDGLHDYELRPADFSSNGASQPYHSPALPTRTQGSLHFAFTLVEPSGDAVSGGAVDSH